MNKITRFKSKGTFLKLALIYFSFLFVQVNLSAQDGEKLFKTSCTACHKLTSDRLVGPGLAGVTEKRSKEWLMGFIRNSQEMIANGDADAVAIFEEYNKVPMPAHPFTDEELVAIIDYMANPEGSAKKEEPAAEEAVAEGGEVDPLVLKGEKIFKNNCKACHSIGTDKVVGPGLKGISDRRSFEWIVKWTQNSADLIASGDPDAVAIFEEFNKVPMPAQPVSEEDIKAILAYIANPPVDKKAASATEEVAQTTEEDTSGTSLIVLIVICVILLGLIFVLNSSRVKIAKAVAEKEGKEFTGPVSLLDAFKYTISNNKGYVAAVVVILVFSGLVNLMGGAMTIGVHQGYKPEQPIKFSHKIHAGDDKIDCNYCHSSARHSKTSGIPSLNLCMNCHTYINGEGKTFLYNGEEYPMDKEIQKIYEYLDYDPKTGKYGDNPKPVKWIKVHNLPDHAFFSHQQHVTVGNQQCQTCHGPVQEMDVVEQHSKLTMGWCIECHRETGVSDKGNGYYEEMHKRMDEEFKNRVMQDGKMTVEEMGGMECAKCHY